MDDNDDEDSVWKEITSAQRVNGAGAAVHGSGVLPTLVARLKQGVETVVELPSRFALPSLTASTPPPRSRALGQNSPASPRSSPHDYAAFSVSEMDDNEVRRRVLREETAACPTAVPALPAFATFPHDAVPWSAVRPRGCVR
jgi:hypothetical protein